MRNCIHIIDVKYVEKLNHLGNMKESDNSMKIDISMKRAKFIGKVNSLNQEFYFDDATLDQPLPLITSLPDDVV